MAKSHITPNGPAKCSATVGHCPYGPGDHFQTLVEARQEFEKRNASQNFSSISKNSTLEEKLKTETPVSIDTTRAELYYKEMGATVNIQNAKAKIAEYEKILRKESEKVDSPRSQYTIDFYNKEIAKLEKIVEENSLLLKKVKEEKKPYDAEFIRRGGWSQAFLVSNGNGHVHKNMECSSCYPTTQYYWMTGYSGGSEKDIVEDAGYRACTICYPSAPVETNPNLRPTKMFTPDEIEKQKAREARETARNAKAAKKEAGYLLPDGKELRFRVWNKGNRYSDFETFKTEREASSWATNHLAERLNEKDIPLAEHLIESYQLRDEGVKEIVKAIAQKHGKTEAEVLAEFNKKAQIKLTAWQKDWRARGWIK